MLQTPLEGISLRNSTIQTLIKLVFHIKITTDIVKKDPIRFGDLIATVQDDLDYCESILEQCRKISEHFGTEMISLPRLDTCDMAQLGAWRQNVLHWFALLPFSSS
jgi:hypothetical protein